MANKSVWETAGGRQGGEVAHGQSWDFARGKDATPGVTKGCVPKGRPQQTSITPKENAAKIIC